MIPRDTIKTVILVTILSLAQLSILISSTDPVLADGGSFGRDFDTIQSFLNTIDEVLIRDRRSTDRKTSKENGLVGYWPMYENSSDIVHDLSGNLNNGTLVNMDANTSWMEGIAVTGTALAFDGVNDHVSIPHSPSLNITGNITVELWAKMAREAPPPSYLPP